MLPRDIKLTDDVRGLLVAVAHHFAGTELSVLAATFFSDQEFAKDMVAEVALRLLPQPKRTTTKVATTLLKAFLQSLVQGVCNGVSGRGRRRDRKFRYRR